VTIRFETREGDWFYATEPTVGEIIAANAASETLEKVTEILDRHILFSRSSFDVMDAYKLTPSKAMAALDALLRLRRGDDMQDSHGEAITVSRDLHVISDEGQCLAAKVVATDEDAFEVIVFAPMNAPHFDRVTLSEATANLRSVTIGDRWHWPRACANSVRSGS